MVKIYDGGVYLAGGSRLVPEREAASLGPGVDRQSARRHTIAYGILQAHNQAETMDRLRIHFDALASHDITYVGIIQTARASGMERFPLPYVLTTCHNTLCAVGGTINEDDHLFGLSACKKYGGIYVPPHIAVIHQYMREQMAGCGKMILGSDSHTRYGALGAMAVGEGGGELSKQLLGDTWDIPYPEVVAVYLDGAPQPGVGPQDIALALIGAVFKNGYVKNKVLEFVGPGVASMDTDYRNGVDVMTTETTCLSSVWQTDGDTEAWLALHGREVDYRPLAPGALAYYDGCVHIDLSTVRPMIALPFHPSNVYEIEDLTGSRLEDALRAVEKEAAALTGREDYRLTDKIRGGRLVVDQGVIAGCAGGNYTNLMQAAHILQGGSCGSGAFSLSVYPSSQPVMMDIVKKGAANTLMAAGAILRTAFCGPCFGAGDTPANGSLSIRHTTRNFPNREGSKPGSGQMAGVALMDARSIAVTAANGGVLTPATAAADGWTVPAYEYDPSAYEKRVYNGYGRADAQAQLVYGPNIKDWPAMEALGDHLLLRVCSRIEDPVTTTDELIPSGETSSYRSNPLGLAEFTLSRRDPGYVARAKAVDRMERARLAGQDAAAQDGTLAAAYASLRTLAPQLRPETVQLGSVVYARKPGDGSAREQAASCQRVLGGVANIAQEYATKRYRSNLINWGMLPFQLEGSPEFDVGDYIYIPEVRTALDGTMQEIPAYVLGNQVKRIVLHIAPMTQREKEIVKAGCLINFNRNRNR